MSSRGKGAHASGAPRTVPDIEGLRIAFAGHNRPHDLGEANAVRRQMDAAFDLLPLRNSILITGLADGADRLAVEHYLGRGVGAVHAVMPHLDSRVPAEFTSAGFQVTWLDGHAAEKGGRSAHLLQTRWVLEDADVLIVVWTGHEARGPGGTADAVRIALQRNTPVLWIKPGAEGPPLLISPEFLESDFGFLEFQEQLERMEAPLVCPATEELVLRRLSTPVPPSPEPPRRGPLQVLARLLERALDQTVWRTFALYRTVMGGKSQGGSSPVAIPDELRADPAFARLSAAYEEADRRASRLAAVHRSQQVFQAVVMILAVAVGSTPAVWPEAKIVSVATELGLAGLTFLVWWSALTSERSRRWGEARRLAEQLRLERAAWALGVSTRDDRRDLPPGSAAEIAWAWRRTVGSPTGAFDADRRASWGGWAIDCLVYEQIAYHRTQGRLNHRLSHQGHQLEHLVFWVFVLLLAGYLVLTLSARRLGFPLPHWLGGALIMAGAITPAFGAASLALEAALGFGDHARRSDAMERQLVAISDALPGAPSLDALQRAARAAIRLHISQEDAWSEEAAHRHLVRA